MKRQDPTKSGEMSSLYERRSASARRTDHERRAARAAGSVRRTAPAIASFESETEFSFNGSQAGVKQFPLRDQHQIHSRSRLVPTKNLSNQSFCSVADDRAAKLAGRGDTKPADPQGVGQTEEREQPIVDPESVLVNLLVLDPTPNPLVRIQALTA
jgi:hypothetical protein